MAAEYRLTYFAVRGRLQEPIRMLLTLGGQKFDEVKASKLDCSPANKASLYAQTSAKVSEVAVLHETRVCVPRQLLEQLC